MSWLLEFRPEVDADVGEAAGWYESREPGLGRAFVEEIVETWESIATHPLIGARHHPSLDIRWRYPKRFPYRIIYQINHTTESVLVIAVLHAARHESRWQDRI